MGCLTSKPLGSEPAVQTSDKVAPGVAKNHYSHPKDHIGLDIDSLRELLVLIEDYNRGRAESEWIVTTADAANKLVKVKTVGLPDGEAAWVNLLAAEHVGVPVVFISHAWGGKIVSLLKAVIAEADERLPTEPAEMYYFDMVSVDQQNTDQAAGNVATSTAALHEMFLPLIKGCDRVLVVATPYDGPMVASRLWCLVEVCVANLMNTQVVLVLSPAEKRTLQTHMESRGGHNAIVKVMRAVSSATASATVPEDEQLLRRFIETSVEGGFRAVDEIFKGALRKWIASTAEEIIEDCITEEEGAGRDEPTVEGGTLASTAGRVLQISGDPAGAMPLFEAALRIFSAVHGGETNMAVAALYTNMGVAYKVLGEPSKAVEHFTKSLKIQWNTVGEKHPSIAISYANLGGAHADLGEPAKAVELYTKALVIQRNTIGEAHPSIANTYSNLGLVHQGLGKRSKAIECYTTALKILKNTIGEEHPNYQAVWEHRKNAQADLSGFDD